MRSEFTELSSHGFRKMVYQSVVKAQTEGNPAGASQRNVVARKIDSLEAIVFLKIAEAVALLFSVGEVRVHEKRMPRSAQDRTACAMSAFVGALSLCSISDTMFIRPACVRVSSMTNLTKPIRLITEKCSDENTAIKKGSFFFVDCSDILPVMGECPSLADRALVVDLPDSLH